MFLFVILFFFFFKWKTAYEMRISDWSSDVCSSDLPSGTGTGASASDPASFAAALSFYRSRLPSKMTINMATGYYTFAPADFSVNPAGAKTDLDRKSVV